MSDGRRIVITAGADGIGLVMAEAFVANGDRVHVCDINEEALRKVTERNPRITGTVCNVADRAEVKGFIDDAVSALNGIDVLVNNAGISGPTASVVDQDPREWDAVLAVNITGPYNVTRLAIPYLKESDSGAIIMMASVGGRYGYANRSAYATTKRAVIALGETLALELGAWGIRVNTIAPGAVAGPRIQRIMQARADMQGRSLEDVIARHLEIQSIKRFVTADEIAQLTVFLASDAAKSITGQTIPIDGGSKAPE